MPAAPKYSAPSAPASTLSDASAAYVARLIAEAPPLSTEQRDRVAALLRGGRA